MKFLPENLGTKSRDKNLKENIHACSTSKCSDSSTWTYVDLCIDTRWEKIYSNYYNTVFKKKNQM